MKLILQGRNSISYIYMTPLKNRVFCLHCNNGLSRGGYCLLCFLIVPPVPSCARESCVSSRWDRVFYGMSLTRNNALLVYTTLPLSPRTQFLFFLLLVLCVRICVGVFWCVCALDALCTVIWSSQWCIAWKRVQGVFCLLINDVYYTETLRGT